MAHKRLWGCHCWQSQLDIIAKKVILHQLLCISLITFVSGLPLVYTKNSPLALLSLSPLQPIPYLDWIMDVRHHSNSWRVKSPAKKVFCTSVSVRGYVHLCVWWSPPSCFFFFKSQWPHPPSTYLINNQWPHCLLLFSSFPLSLCLYHQSAPNWFFYQTNSIPSPREVPVSEGAAWKRDARYENKEAPRSTHTWELWSAMETDDIIVSGQSWSHRRHAALIHLTSTLLINLIRRRHPYATRNTFKS